MGHREFFTDAAKKRAAEAVKTVESQTSAEIVVAVRQLSGSYRDAHLVAAGLFGFVVLLLLLFLPQSFEVGGMPLDVALGAAVGYALASRSEILRRLFTSGRARLARVTDAAKAAFVDFGISRTTGRTGVLVYVSVLERRASLVGDTALQTDALKNILSATETALSGAIARGDFAAFIGELERLGPALAPLLPRSADDVNELPDEVR